MTEQEYREAIIAESKKWIGAKWAHNAKVPYIACDCGQFILAVYEAVGLIPVVPTGKYNQDWHIHNHQELYLKWVEKYCDEISEEEAMEGDLIVFKFAHTYSHGSIIVDKKENFVIHSYVERGVMMDDYTKNTKLSNRNKKYYSIFPRLRKQN